MIYNIRKETFEDRFGRKYYCQNARKFIRHQKRDNRRCFRRKLEKYLKEEVEDEFI